MYRRLLDSVGEGEDGMFQENSIETCILSRVKQITSPGWMHETSARGWCTGKTQRDRVEREVGGGIGVGNTCKPMADSYQCMTKSLQYCQVISLQLIKINGKNKSRHGKREGRGLQMNLCSKPDAAACECSMRGVRKGSGILAICCLHHHPNCSE